MSGSHSASSRQALLPSNGVSPEPGHQNEFLNRDPTSISTNDVGLNKMMDNNPQVGEQTFAQVEIENPNLNRKVKRSELANKNAFLTRRWQTALVSALVVAVLAGAIGGLAYWITLPKVITQPYLLYGETCYTNSRSCDATRMLWCPAGKCICTGDFTWNATAQNCSCGVYQMWTGFRCQGYGYYGDPCTTVPCRPTLTCNSVVNQTYTTSQMICSCDNATYLDVTGGSSTLGQCIPKISYNASCKTVQDCQTWVGLSCTYSTSTSDTRCQCDSTSYWNGTLCVQNARGWQPCSGSIPCDTTRGLTCQAGTCECDSLSFWDNVTTQWCQQKRTYSVACQYDFQCNTTVNLTCPSISTGCNCPTSSSAGICDCQLGYFWDGQRCSAVHMFNGTCPGQYACGTNLVCYLGHCICPGNMIWNTGINCTCPGTTSWNTGLSTCI